MHSYRVNFIYSFALFPFPHIYIFMHLHLRIHSLMTYEYTYDLCLYSRMMAAWSLVFDTYSSRTYCDCFKLKKKEPNENTEGCTSFICCHSSTKHIRRIENHTMSWQRSKGPAWRHFRLSHCQWWNYVGWWTLNYRQWDVSCLYSQFAFFLTKNPAVFNKQVFNIDAVVSE